jgi:tRNA1(Val) A37 N6-methylase TrmN6
MGGRGMRIERVWAMPSKWTFTINPIKKLLAEEMDGGLWCDPMAGMHSPAQVRNDINPEANAEFHMDALDFLKQQPHEHYDGVLFDPPYSWQNAKTLYGLENHHTMTRGIVPFYNHLRTCRKAIVPLVKPNGKVILFGHDSMGLGKRNGYHMERILMLHSRWYELELIITVERKVQTTL